MQTYKLSLLFLLLLVSFSILNASSITQRGSIVLMSMEKSKIEINIEVNGVKLLKQTYPIDYKKLKVWWKNRRLLDLDRLKKGIKIELKTNQGKLYYIRVLDNNGYDLEPQG